METAGQVCVQGRADPEIVLVIEQASTGTAYIDSTNSFLYSDTCAVYIDLRAP